MKIRTLVVEDMPLARKRIRRFLSMDPDIQIVGECANGQEAVDAIREMRPDLVFLDVQMPEMGGFEVLEKIDGEARPMIIFVTAYDQFALKAFEVHALDYLLKPFNAERLRGSVNRAKNYLQREQATDFDSRIRALLDDIKAEQQYLKRLAIKSTGRVVLLPVDEIDWIEAEGNYASIHTGNETHLLRERMTQLETKLDPARFVRIHRSTIVNISRIRELQPLFNGDQRVILCDGTQLTASRKYRDRLLELLEKSY